MCNTRLRLLTLAMCMLMGGCGSSVDMPTAPAGTLTFAGQWTGTTSQGRPITFTVSSDQKVTAISIGYSFSTCAGVNTFSDLNLDIGNPPNPAGPQLGPGFGYGSGNPELPNYTQVYGSFTSSTTANGSMIFGSFSGCGNSGGIWSATRR